MKEDCYDPSSSYKQLFSKSKLGYFHDLRYIAKNNLLFKSQDNILYFNRILSQKVLKTASANNNQKALTELLQKMRSQITPQSVTIATWLFHKTMRVAMQGLHVDHDSINKVKQHIIQGNQNVVLMPVFKSFADTLLMVYICVEFGL